MKRKYLIVLPLLFLLIASVGIAFARSNVSTPPPEFNAAATDFAAVCPTNLVTPEPAPAIACDKLANDGATAVTTYGQDQYNQALKDLGVGKDYCFFAGQYAVNHQSCNGQEPPPINNCSGIFKGGLLSPTLATATLNGVTIYLFQSNAGGCGGVWTGAHGDTSVQHTIGDVSIADESSDADGFQTQHAIASQVTPRQVGLNDWTSTYMIDYVPGHTYQASATVDGLFVTASFTIPV